MLFFFFNDTATTEIYTLSLHDALPISHRVDTARVASLIGASEVARANARSVREWTGQAIGDRKSTRLNSSHGYTSYAVFCLQKKNCFQRPAESSVAPPCPDPAAARMKT